jgi:long-chain acyl-CoA synthetase
MKFCGAVATVGSEVQAGDGRLRAAARLGELIDRAGGYPADVVAVDAAGAQIGWQALAERATWIREELDFAGVPPGGHVGLVLDTDAAMIAALMATLSSGRTVVTLNPLQPVDRLVGEITSLGLWAVIGLADRLSVAELRDAVPGLQTPSTLAVGGLLSPLALPRLSGGQTSVGVAIVMATSGTTGQPRRIALTHKQLDSSLSANGVPLTGELTLRSGARIMATPLTHISGLWNAVAALCSGRKLVLLAKFGVDSWLAAVRTHRPKAVGVVPAGLRALLDARPDPADLASVQVITAGTAPCDPVIVDEFLDRYGIRVLPVYGATEFSGAVAGWDLQSHQKYWAHKRGSVGRLRPGVLARIVDGTGIPLATGECGLLELRSEQIGSGDWVRTNDCARLDSDGFLFITGRADDVISRGGFKVSPSTVAQALEAHPAVREAVVVGVADARLGHVPNAVVETEPGAAVDEEELIAFARERLAPYEVPARIVVTAQLPRNETLKPAKSLILALLQESETRSPA